MNWFQKLRLRIRALFQKEKLDAQMNDEMRSHIEMQTQENIEAGMKPEEARYTALRQFGWVESIKDTCCEQRGVSWIENLGQDIRYGARQLRKNPGFTAVAVLTLALGIGATTAIFSIVNTVLLQPLMYPNADRIVMIETFRSDTGRPASGVSGPDFIDWKAQSSVFESMAHFRGEDDLATVVGDRAGFANTRSVSSEFFGIFGLQPSAGRFLSGEDTPSAGASPTVAVVSHSWAVRHFGSSKAAVGKKISVYRTPLEIVGVAPPGFRFPSSIDVWAPDRPATPSNRSAERYQVVGKLKPGVDFRAAQGEFRIIGAALAKQYSENKFKTPELIPLQDKLTGAVQATLWALMGAVILVLIIACANVSNLLISRSTRRQREMAVRSALGAGRGRLIRQLLTESFVLAVIAAVAGLAMTFVLVEGIVALSPSNLPRIDEVRLDRVVFLFALGLSFLSTLAFGLLPAANASRLDLAEALKQGGSKGTVSGGSTRLRFALVVTEVALSFMLLAGAGLLLRSFQALHGVDLGFTPDRVVAVYTQYPLGNGRDENGRVAFYREILQRLRNLPGVAKASGAAMLPLGREPRPASEYFIQGRPEGELGQRLTAQFQAITPDFLATLQIPLRLGRDVEDSDRLETPPVALINESLARIAFPNQSPVGQRIRTGSNAPWMEIVGTVADTRWWDATQPPRPEVFTASAQGTGGSLSILIQTSLDKNSLAHSLRALIHEIDPTVPMRFETMDEMFAETLAYPRFRTQLLSGFAGGALILAAVGLYGVLAYTVNQRVREIGIRVALGARRRDVIGLVIREGMRPALLGIVLGLVGALACSRLLERLLYEVKPADVLTLTTVCLTLLVAAFLACCFPARRAAKLDPMVALRYE